MFFSEEAAKIWCIGVEGVTYTMDGDKIVYADDIKNSANGIYKHMQLAFGAGSDVTQMVWVNEREMTKYDENYSLINQEVAAMENVIQSIPPTPKFDDLTAEDAGSLQTPLADAFIRWDDAFVTGAKSIEADWDAYVTEMKNLQIEQFCQMYNDNL
jgi:putative aldouronate transport system substrate-binding protein